MEERRIEGLWDCSYCKATGIKARFDECPSCGSAKGKETVFYLPDDIDAAVLTQEEKEKQPMNRIGYVNIAAPITNPLSAVAKNVPETRQQQGLITECCTSSQENFLKKSNWSEHKWQYR